MLVKNELYPILRQMILNIAAPNLVKSLHCLSWGVGCDPSTTMT